MDYDVIDGVSVDWQVSAKLNFACHQNSYPVLRDLRIENNNLENPIENLTVYLRSEPPFLKEKAWAVDRIGAGGVVSVRDRVVQLDGSFLLNLADSLQGAFVLTVEQGGEVIFEARQAVELLAYNEWGGAGYMPELLAAFSTPNDPAIDRVLHGASRILRNAGKTDALDGYKTQSRQRVWEVTSAIYAAIANLGLTYAVPPASFERDGQKIRLPSQILDGRVGTCLDTTMLFAAALEQAGLNPIVALPKGHALVGVWLQPDELNSILVEDAEILRKLVTLKELILVETTLVTSHPTPPMSKAIELAMGTIREEADATFGAAVDIRRARAHRIMPLGLKVGEHSAAQEEDEVRIEIALEEAPVLPDFESDKQEELPDKPEGRLERWQRRLLDLSARNPLLNHKSSVASLAILCPDPGELEDRLAAGEKIAISPMPRSSAQEQDQEVHARRTGEVISEEYVLNALKNKQILVDLSEQDLSKRAVEIYRRAQASLQEGGANTLFLAIGFLAWKRDEKDEKRFRAPLILLPVTLQRKSVRSGLRMVAHDDEPRFNTTLLEMLRKDFSIDIKGLDEKLPEDQSGVDVAGIWDHVRRAVKEAPGFEVIEDVVLGHFSFAKYLMWKDLVDRTDALRENAVVRHLLDSPRDAYPSEIGFVSADRLDRDFAPSDLLAPLPADASQMAAIATADRGKDFIIIGPPGTGKSQTISNLIAHLMGKGKTVLFVSEKTAALNVVHRRLQTLGLGRFCLELHSNKAKKAEVLQQLADAWAHGETLSSEDWAREAERLKNTRDRLNGVVDYLHTPKRNGLTPHYAIGVRVRDAALAQRVTFTWPHADHHDALQREALVEVVDKLRIQAKEVGSFGDNPLAVISTGDWFPDWEENLIAQAQELSKAVGTLEQAHSAFAKAIGVGLPNQSLRHGEAGADLAKALLGAYRQDVAFALEPDGLDRLDALERVVEPLKAYTKAQTELSVAFEPMAWRALDGDNIIARWQAAEATWWPKKHFAKSSILKDMQANGARGKPAPLQDGATLARLRQEGEKIDRFAEQLSGLRFWQGHDTDPLDVAGVQALGVRLRGAIGALIDDPLGLATTRGAIKTLLQDGNDLLAPEASVGRAAARYLEAHLALTQAAQGFAERAGSDLGHICPAEDFSLTQLRAMADRVIARKNDLHDWCAWRKRRIEAMDLDLGALVEAIEAGQVPADEIPDTFEAAYCTWWSGRLFGEDEMLRCWSTPEHEDAIEKFRAADERFQSITASYISAVLCGKIPSKATLGRDQQWGLVNKLTKQKRPRVPIRKLFEDAPEPISKLAPCMMMSPLSVAQYLPAGQAPFDVVIFDEASQLTVWDAVGAIARGKQTVIAGDPKQMPPTNFFARANDDPDGDINYDGDLESILDELQGAGIPEQTLNLHYRSRRESLIAFSNMHYYDHRLITFPAPIHPDQGVQLRRPHGFYARGKARHNEGEAKAIVEEIVRRLRSSDEVERKATIGVVTFNSEQQSLILDLLDKARSEFPDIEWAFAEDAHEPVFVKNLETVQGDERDVILFSITYGPDQSGHVTMTFGPLNRDGGERRLNVAMTRSRTQMVVFSTLSPDKIDLSRSKAEAVKHLKHFLEYAERGPSALGAAVHGSVGDFDSPFETAVARGLRDMGWTLHPQIGVSAYRIDIGIVHPDEPGVYLAGVECDGAMYHSSAYARERDKIRQAMLEGLGWTLFRVWSTDWWLNKAGALEKLDALLQEHLASDREKRRLAREAAAAAAAASAEGEAEAAVLANQTLEDPDEGLDDVQNAESVSTELTAPDVDQNDRPLKPEAPPLPLPPSDNDLFAVVQDQAGQETVAQGLLVPEDISPQTGYVIADLSEARFTPEPDRFYDSDYEIKLNAMLDHIIDAEGPIHEDVLIRRIARHHGFQRAGRQIREVLHRLAGMRRGSTNEEVGRFYWRKRTVKDRLAPHRYQNRNDELRKIEHISADELKAISRVLGSDDPIELARGLGIARLNAAARSRLEHVLGSP